MFQQSHRRRVARLTRSPKRSFTGISKKTKIEPVLAEVLRTVAPKIGARVVFEPEWGVVGCIIYKSGRRRYFRNSTLDINRMAASEISRDKGYSKYFLHLLGFPVVEGKVFYSKQWSKAIGSRNNIDEAYNYARHIGFPVFVKPNSKSRGIGVAKVFTRAEFYQAMRRAFNHDDVALVETAVIDASDYRIVVLDDQVISAYERIPLSVTGDGRSSIRRLLVNKQKNFERLGRDSRLNLRDVRVETKLARLKLDLKSRLGRGRQIFLLDNANLSSGGESRDVTSIVHPEFCRLAIRVTQGMGLRLCGVDLLVKDGSLADPAKKFYVLEINSAPGLDHYAKIGDEQRRIVERLYLAVIKAMER